MNITIEINEARLVHYSPEAKNELKRQLDTIADSLAEEANRIEGISPLQRKVLTH